MSLLVTLLLIAVTIDEGSSRRWHQRRFSEHSQNTPQGRSSDSCLSGDGSSYRGNMSITTHGRRCLNWDIFKYWEHYQTSKGLGPHNYCRNPNQSLRPWCRVVRRGRLAREFCGIRECEAEPAPTATTAPTHTSTIKPQAPVDTELTCGERMEQRLNKIVGGVFTPIQSQPWVATLFHKRKGFLCGASLIAPCWVLTAAHCFKDGIEKEPQHLSVYLGKNAINETDADKEQRFTVEQLIMHPKYSMINEDYNNDIALIKISRGGQCVERTPWARTVCLPPPHTALAPGMECSIAGYGNEKEGLFENHSQYLKQTTVKMISQSTCKRKSYYGSNDIVKVTGNMFCAGSPSWSTDACQGDSGSPLVYENSGRMFLFGVVSWGEGCAQRNKPGVYTRVTNYNNWIAETTGLPAFTAGLMYPQK